MNEPRNPNTQHPQPSSDTTWFANETERAKIMRDLEKMTATPRRNPAGIAMGVTALAFAPLFLFLAFDRDNLWLLARPFRHDPEFQKGWQ